MEEYLDDLVAANRIIAREGVVDGYGHVSVRHPERPDRYFMSCSKAPEQVRREDILEFDLDSQPLDANGRDIYSEAPIHGEIYKARPDVNAVIHNHAESVIPFGVTRGKLRQMIHVAGGMGTTVPVWDMRDKFGDTDLLVTTSEHGQDLAEALGENTVVLMRGHGCTVAGQELRHTVKIAIYTVVNARLQTIAMQMEGEVRYMTDGEAAATRLRESGKASIDRSWANWRRRAGYEVADKLRPPGT